MGSGGTEWDVEDIVAIDRLNQKTNFVGTGSQINGLSGADLLAGMRAFCTSTGNNFFKNKSYRRNADNTAWDREVQGKALDQVYPLSVTIGDYATPATAVATSEASGGSGTVAVNGGTQIDLGAGFNGTLRASKLTGLTVGNVVDKCGVNIFSTFSGNIRLKLYNDVANSPDTLLGETGSFALTANGFTDVDLLFNVIVPSDGILWIAVEFSSATVRPSGLATTTSYGVAHTFGAGPTSFVETATNMNDINMRITYGNFEATMAVDDKTAHNWKSNSENNPAIYVDTGVAQEIIGLAVNLDRTATTETQIKIRISTDTTFSDPETVRLINITDLTDDTWRFITLPRQAEDRRYIQIYGVGTSKVLSINEIKYRVKTNAQVDREHFHEYLDPTNAGDNFLDGN